MIKIGRLHGHALTQTFFATVQNKVHYAIHGQTAAELIATRADSSHLRAASLADADVYTLEKMVAQFADGIARCLGR